MPLGDSMVAHGGHMSLHNWKLWQWSLAGTLGWAWLMPHVAGGDFGGRKEREKEARRQEDIARQNEESQNMLNQFLSQLVPGSEEYNQLQAQGLALVRATAGAGDQQDQIRQLGSQFVTAQQARIAGGGPATALEARTDLATRGLRELSAFTPEEQATFSALRGEAFGPGQETMGRIFADLVARAQNPEQFFSSTLRPQLDLAQEQVKARAAQRGLLGSGLELENLGRTGAELAVREAQARESFRQQQLQGVMGLYDESQELRNRQLGLEGNLVNLQLGRESNLTNLLRGQTGDATENLLELLGARTTRSENLRDVASALREAERQRLESYLYPELDIQAGPVKVGVGGGGQSTFSTAFSPVQGDGDAASLIASSRAPTGGQVQQPLAGSLSLQGNQSSDAFKRLQQLLQGMA